MKKRRQIQHGMQGVFIFVLLGLFAMMSILLVLFGAQMYRGSVDLMEKNSRNRILYSYVRSMVRAEDSRDLVAVEEHEGVTALAMYETISDTEYVTWIYAFEGKLYEQFTDATSDFSPARGVEIMEIGRFEPSVSGRLLTVEMTDASGNELTVSEAIRGLSEDHEPEPSDGGQKL